MKRSIGLVLAGILAAAANARAERVDNFVLLDQHGDAHELYYLGDAQAIVIMVHGNGCPIVRNGWSAFKALRDAYSERGVEFLMLNSNPQDDRASILAEAGAFGMDVPILDDDTQLVGESLNLIRTAEVLIIDPDRWQLVYRGPIDDRLTYERQKPAATEHYVRDALETLLAGRSIEVAQRDALGCLINFPEKRAEGHRAISYSETVAPVLAERCAGCHRDGGIAPWAMNGYRMIQGFAPMIREVLRTKRMPPWHADPDVGEWRDDRSLSVEETRAIVHWVEAGAPRGPGPDPLATRAEPAADWPLGEPDLIVTVPAFTVPETGVVDYQYQVVANPLEQDVWVRAAVIAPGDRALVHHVRVGYSASAAVPEQPSAAIFENHLTAYAPGMEPYSFPEDTGVQIQAGGAFLFEMHYTPVGRAAPDVTRLGLYFHERMPARILREHAVIDLSINIPPHAARHEESAYFAFDKDAVIYSLFPHAHYRGRSSRFVLQSPDGAETLLLAVPRYDFYWQREYRLAEPLPVPAGSRIIHSTVYDNSARHRDNPDPSRTVAWGEQTWDEMLYGGIRFRWKDERAESPIHDARLAGLQVFYGWADRDMDGRLTLAEMPEGMRKRFETDFGGADRNGDGGISVAEFVAFPPPEQQP